MLITKNINLERQLIAGKSKIDHNLFQNIKIKLKNKPSGGLWSSTYNPTGKYKSDWTRFCINEKFMMNTLKEGITFKFRKNIRVFQIDNAKDFEEFVKIVGKIEFFKVSKDIGFDDDFNKGYDFIKASKLFDVIHLTKNGEFETRYNFHENLYGWDCESCFIMNLKSIDFKTIKKVGSLI